MSTLAWHLDQPLRDRARWWARNYGPVWGIGPEGIERAVIEIERAVGALGADSGLDLAALWNYGRIMCNAEDLEARP